MITESYNFPINRAGVIVVPREHALKVGCYVGEIQHGDQAGRAATPRPCLSA